MNPEDQRVYRTQAELGATKVCLGCERRKFVYQFEAYGRLLCRACMAQGVRVETLVRAGA